MQMLEVFFSSLCEKPPNAPHKALQNYCTFSSHIQWFHGDVNNISGGDLVCTKPFFFENDRFQRILARFGFSAVFSWSVDFLIKRWIAFPPPITDDYFQQGWVYLHPSLYYVSPDKKSWSESRQDCLQRQSDLLILSNDLEQVRISKHVAVCFSRLRFVCEDMK